MAHWMLTTIMWVSFASLTLVIGVFTFTIAYTIQVTSRMSNKFEEVCLDCKVMFEKSHYPDESPLKTRTFRVKDGHLQCCIHHSHAIRILEALSGNENRESSNNQRCQKFPSQIVSAHKKLFKPNASDSNLLGNITCLKLGLDAHVIEHSQGVTVNQHDLSIQFAGLYYIYRSINLLATDSNNPMTQFSTYVLGIRPKDTISHDGVMLRSVHSGRDELTSSNFMGGSFYLQRGDKLKVCVTDYDVVDFNTGTTFLGVFLLARTDEG